MRSGLLKERTVEAVVRAARPVTGVAEDYDSLLDLIGDRRIVLIGEASHGTHEFYRERARITRRLIDELGFTVVAVEGDWPDAYRVNRYVMGMSADPDAEAALRGFRRFPDLDVAEPGRAGLRPVAPGPQRRPDPSRRQGPLLRARPLQPADLDRGGHRLSRPVDPSEA